MDQLEREAFARAFEADRRFKLLGHADSPEGIADRFEPDVTVISPRADTSVLPRVLAAFSETNCLVISDHSEASFVTSVFRHGARGLLRRSALRPR